MTQLIITFSSKERQVERKEIGDGDEDEDGDGRQ